MTKQQTTVRNYFAAFGAGDVEQALSYVHPDAVWHIDGDPALVTVGIIQGHPAIRDWLTRFASGFQPLAFSIDHIVGEGGEVVVIGRFRHRIVVTGTVVDSDYVVRFTVQGGLIRRYQIFEDSLLLGRAHHDGSPARTALINGTRYGWDDVGAGPPLIFLHGMFLGRGFWSRQVEALSASYRCVSFDMPGHGASGWREGLDLDGIAEDMALWIAEHGAAPATLVGHSQGGMIALRIAARHPALVARLILVNTSARAEFVDRLPAWQDRRAALLGSDAERSALFGDIQRLKSTPAWLAAHPEEAAEELALMASHDPALLANALDAAVLRRRDFRDPLASIEIPTVVLSGTEDIATPAELGREIAGLVPTGTFLVMDGVAHAIPIERKDELNKVILQGPTSGEGSGRKAKILCRRVTPELHPRSSRPTTRPVLNSTHPAAPT